MDPSKGLWKCFGCGLYGDAAALVMRLRNLTFPEAVAFLTGATHQGKSKRADGTGPLTASDVRARPSTLAGEIKGEIKSGPTGLPEADALALVEAATARLWSIEGADALNYLRGLDRCLSAETIRSARLGWTPGVMVPTRDGDRSFRASGIVIPWFAGDRLAVVKLRQPPGRKPKYAEAFRDPSRIVCYPGLEAIKPGRPLIVTEGEFDALALGEAVNGMASVVTLGSASARPLDPNPCTRGRRTMSSLRNAAASGTTDSWTPTEWPTSGRDARTNASPRRWPPPPKRKPPAFGPV